MVSFQRRAFASTTAGVTGHFIAAFSYEETQGIFATMVYPEFEARSADVEEGCPTNPAIERQRSDLEPCCRLKNGRTCCKKEDASKFINFWKSEKCNLKI